MKTLTLIFTVFALLLCFGEVHAKCGGKGGGGRAGIFSRLRERGGLFHRRSGGESSSMGYSSTSVIMIRSGGMSGSCAGGACAEKVPAPAAPAPAKAP